jgi:Flp pilus assembly protein TadG
MTSGAFKLSNRIGRLAARFAAAERGATAVEFSLVALPFFALLFAILELGLVFMVSTNLESATDQAARQIRTGEVQTAGGTAATFKTAICAQMVVSDCASNLKIDVRTFDQFADVDTSDPVKDGKFDDTKLRFAPGGPEDIVLVRAYYQWTLITPMLNTAMQSLANGKRLISATATFQNEPYET